MRSEAPRQKTRARAILKVRDAARPPRWWTASSTTWQGAEWATIDRSGVAAYFDSNSRPYDVTAAVAVAGDRLYAAFRTGDPELLENSGEMPRPRSRPAARWT